MLGTSFCSVVVLLNFIPESIPYAMCKVLVITYTLYCIVMTLSHDPLPIHTHT